MFLQHAELYLVTLESSKSDCLFSVVAILQGPASALVKDSLLR
jgi:hypothetical protein